MLVIGLTGGIGSGKSTVAKLFAAYGIPIIDADMIAREVTQSNSPTIMDIVNHFEERLLLNDGSLDRAKLRKIIFEKPDQRRWLEDLLHPLIRDRIEKQIKEISAPYCIVVIPLLFEVEPYHFIQRTLVVDSPENLQIKRVATRDNTPRSQVEAILRTQLPRSLRLSQANDVITNDGTLAHLEAQVERLHGIYLRRGQNKFSNIP